MSDDFGFAALHALQEQVRSNLADAAHELADARSAAAASGERHRRQLLRTAHANELVVSLERKLQLVRHNAICAAPQGAPLCVVQAQDDERKKTENARVFMAHRAHHSVAAADERALDLQLLCDKYKATSDESAEVLLDAAALMYVRRDHDH